MYDQPHLILRRVKLQGRVFGIRHASSPTLILCLWGTVGRIYPLFLWQATKQLSKCNSLSQITKYLRNIKLHYVVLEFASFF